jgi:aspartate kinase
MTASIVVQKYGGSSVADVGKIQRVAARVVETARSGRRVCVVVSAMGDTTDELLELAKKITPAPPRRELDMLVSCGERIAMALLSMAIAELGQEAISFTGSQSGILTNDRHSGARIIEVRPVRIQDELERGRIVIVAGFQGVSYKREITTLGRGGSDTTAVALAAALGAEYCELCSDVDGVYSADPRVVDAPRLLAALSYDEAQELAEHGARVLNPQAVEFARKAGIAIYARATAQAPTLEGGTRVGGPTGAHGAVGVAGMRDLVRVRGQARELSQALARERVPLKRFTSDGETATALFGRDDLPDWAAVRARLGEVTVEDGLAAASVVGEGVGTDPTCLQRALAAAAHGVELLGVDVTPLRLTLYLAPAHLDDVVRALHRDLVAAC